MDSDTQDNGCEIRPSRGANRGFRPGPFDYHQEIEVTVESLTNQGAGVARVDGWVVFIPFSIPGERVRARVYRNHKHHSDADLMAVLEGSPHRVDPRCPLFGSCGGCQYQHLGYPEQLAWKRRQVSELLERMAGITADVDPVVPSPLEYGYRSKITPHFQKPRKGEIAAIGFLRHGQRHAVVDVPECPIASPPLNTALGALRSETRMRADRFRRGATLLLRDCGGHVLTDPGEIATEEVSGIRFRFPAGDFFQNNPSILPAFTGHVADEAAAPGIRFLVDTYCGSGLFCLTAAGRFERVVGVEISESSADWARENARANRIDHADFVGGDAEAVFAGIDFPPDATSVVIDPPRKGCSEAFLDQLFAFGPARVVYVSCNPATQVRDLARFRDAGFRLERVRPFDLFPQTKHLECVATLARARGRG